MGNGKSIKKRKEKAFLWLLPTYCHVVFVRSYRINVKKGNSFLSKVFFGKVTLCIVWATLLKLGLGANGNNASSLYHSDFIRCVLLFLGRIDAI